MSAFSDACHLIFFIVIRCKRNNSSTCRGTKLRIKFVNLCDPRQIVSHCTIVEFGTTRFEMDISTPHIWLRMPLLCTWILYLLLYSKFKV